MQNAAGGFCLYSVLSTQSSVLSLRESNRKRNHILDRFAVFVFCGFEPPLVGGDFAGFVDFVAAAGLEDGDTGDFAGFVEGKSEDQDDGLAKLEEGGFGAEAELGADEFVLSTELDGGGALLEFDRALGGEGIGFGVGLGGGIGSGFSGAGFADGGGGSVGLWLGWLRGFRLLGLRLRLLQGG
jgi:uncharacterized membrane protein YgcG